MSNYYTYNCGTSWLAVMAMVCGDSHIATAQPTIGTNYISKTSGVDVYFWYTGATAGTSPAFVAPNDVKNEIKAYAGLKSTVQFWPTYYSNINNDPVVLNTGGVTAGTTGGHSLARIYYFVLRSSVDYASISVDIVQMQCIYSQSLACWVYSAAAESAAIAVSLGGFTLAAADLAQLAEGVGSQLNVVNNITVEPSTVNVDLSGVEAALAQLVQDSTVAGLDLSSAQTDLTDLVLSIDDVVTAIGDVPDLTAQLNETNRQLSLIESDLVEVDPGTGARFTLVEATAGGSGGGGGFKILKPDGTAIDLESLLEKIVEAQAACGLLVGDKMEAMRGFFALLKDKWS